MPSVVFRSASFSYTSGHVVLDAVDLAVGPGWTGVVGPNGAGKSTVLQLAAGALEPSSGSVAVTSSAPPLLCAQTSEIPDEHVHSFAGSFEPDDFVLRGRLDLQPEDLDRWPTLSPGERKRWQIGAALSARPDVLLLDEPTNHLDAESRALLLDALGRFGGLGLVVSHDRDLLEALTTATIRVEHGGADLWGGPYSVASAEWRAADEAAQAAHQTAKRELAKAERRIADRRRTLETKSARFARTMRRAAAKDHDTHSTSREAKHQAGAAAASKGLSNLAAERERLRSQVEESDVRRPIGGSIRFDGEAAPRPVLVRLEGSLTAGGRTLVDEMSLTVDRDSRVHLTGPNGAGKSTLLRRIADQWDLDADRLLYLPQELDEAAAVRLLERVRGLPPGERGRVLQLVARLGTDPEVLLATDLPSPGEARKLAMAMGLGTEAWLLLLDEPTNHLDLATIERLEAALAGYPGALVVVAHDPVFTERVTDTVWAISDGRLVS